MNYMLTLTKFDHLSQDSKSILTRHAIENVDTYKFSSLASICDCLVKINHEDGVVFDIIKMSLIKRFTAVDISQLASEVTSIDLAQFMTAFTHFERYDAEILTILEQVFVQILDQAGGKETAAMLINHSQWNQQVLKYDYRGIKKTIRKKANKKHFMLSRTEKVFKKYNHELTEKFIENLATKADEINLNALIQIQSNLLSNNIRKNSTKRSILDFFSHSGLKVFKAQLESDADLDIQEFRRLLCRYYAGVRKICFKKEQLQTCVEMIYQTLGYNIFTLRAELSPIFKAHDKQTKWEEEIQQEIEIPKSIVEDVELE